MQIKNLSQLLILGSLLTFFNIYILLGNSLFSYTNFNPLMILRENGSLHYFAFIAVPVLSFLIGVSMLMNVLNGKFTTMQPKFTNSNMKLVKYFYVYVAINFLLLSLLSMKNVFIN